VLFRLCNPRGNEGKKKLSVQVGKRSLAELNDDLPPEFWFATNHSFVMETVAVANFLEIIL